MKLIQDFTISMNKMLNSDSFLLRLQSEKNIPEILPGQFAQIEIINEPKVMLRRPISIHDVNYDANYIDFYIKIAGNGTKKISKMKIGEQINIIYPLGNSYTIREGSKKVLMVGGGSGIAPFLLFSKILKEKGIESHILLGAKTAEYIVQQEAFKQNSKLFITTEDGSLGEKGLVTMHSLWNNNEYDMVYTCGPNPMMKAIGELCEKRNISCEASLENMMACGFGACLCCVTPTYKGNICVCTEGPVFNTRTLKW